MASGNRTTISVSGAFYGQLRAVVAELQSRQSSAAARRAISMASIVEAALDGFELTASFVGRMSSYARPPQLSVRVSLPIGLGDPRLPRPVGNGGLSKQVAIDVSRELYEMVDDQRTRVRELEQRETSHSELFEAAINLALAAAKREGKRAA